MKIYSYNPLDSIPYLNMPMNSQVVMNINNGNNYIPPH